MFKRRTTSNRRKKALFRFLRFLAFLAVVGFVLTRSYVLRPLIAPKIERDLGINIRSGSLTFDPIQGFVFKNVTATPHGSDLQVFACERIQIHASLKRALGSGGAVKRVTLEAPKIWIEYNLDGSTPMEPFFKSRLFSRGARRTTNVASLDALIVNDGTVEIRQAIGSALRRVNRWDAITIEGADLGKVVQGTLTSTNDFELRLERAATSGDWEPVGSITGQGTMELQVRSEEDETLAESRVQLEQRAKGASGIYREAGADLLALRADFGNKALKNAIVRYTRGSRELLTVRASGPLDLTSKEFLLNFELDSTNAGAWDYWALPKGIDWTGSEVGANGSVALSQNGTLLVVNARGQTRGLQFQSANGSLPPTDVSMTFRSRSDLTEETMLIRQETTATAIQNGRTALQISFNRPMNIAYGESRPNFKDATATIQMDGIDLAPLSWVTPGITIQGAFSGEAEINASADARLIAFNVDGSAEQLRLAQQDQGSEAMGNPVTLAITAGGQISDFRRLVIDRMDYSIADPATTESPFVEGTMDLERSVALDTLKLSITTKAEIPALAAFLPFEGFEASDGQLNAAVRYDTKGDFDELRGDVQIGRFTGQAGPFMLNDFSFQARPRCEFSENGFKLSQLSVTTKHGLSPGLNLNARGDYNAKRRAGDGRIEVIQLDDGLLRELIPYEDPTMELSTFTANGRIDLRYSEQEDLTLESAFTLQSVVISSKDGARSPMASAQITAKGTLRPETLQFQEASLAFGPNFRSDIDRFQLDTPWTISLERPELAPPLRFSSQRWNTAEFANLVVFARNNQGSAPRAAVPLPLELELKTDEAIYGAKSVADWTFRRRLDRATSWIDILASSLPTALLQAAENSSP